ncbi:MAG: hypothetical protein KAQ92_01430, partial [Candidatus Aenigmarchaeota archaeon]|nr:hypothetical protein [Candidatus Aenigmarchaeota archaeon]
MNKKITTLEHKLKEQIKALEKYKDVLPKDSRLIGQIDELVKKAKYIDKEALERFGGELLKHTGHLINEIQKIKQKENLKAEDSRQMWLNADPKIMKLLPEEDANYWKSIDDEERGLILDAMKESAETDKPSKYPKKLGEKLKDILGVKRVLNKMRPSDIRIPEEFEFPGSVSNEEEKGIKNGKEIKIPPYSPIKEGNVWEEEKGPLSQYSNKGVFDKELKDGLSHELRHQKELIPKIVDFNNKYSKYDDMILSKKEEKEIQNEADKDNEKFLTKDEPFAYFKSWYDRMSEKTIKSVLSGISIDSCNYFEDMLNLNNKLKKNGFSKQQAAQIILSFDSSNIDEIGVLLHNEEDFNEFVSFAKTESDKREVASKYLALKTAGKSVFEGKTKKEKSGILNKINKGIKKLSDDEKGEVYLDGEKSRDVTDKNITEILKEKGIDANKINIAKAKDLMKYNIKINHSTLLLSANKVAFRVKRLIENGIEPSSGNIG